MAIHFNGGTDRMRWGPQGFVPTSGCVAMFIRTTQTTVNTCLFSHLNGVSSAGGPMFLLNSMADKISAYGKHASGADSFWIHSTTTMNDGQWHHIAMNWSAGTGNPVDLWIDGVKEATANNAGNFQMASSAEPFIGATYDSFWTTYNGDIAEYFESCGRWLDDAEIIALSKGFTPDVVFNKKGVTGYFYAPLLRSSQNLFDQFAYATVGTSHVKHPRIFR